MTFMYKKLVPITRHSCKYTVDTYIDVRNKIRNTILFINRRKSISGNWKANIGSAMLEQVPVTEKHRKWLDEVSNIFGGLDVVTIEAIASKDGKEIIYEVTGSQMTLMGETAEEDRRLISDLVTTKMSTIKYRSPSLV